MLKIIIAPNPILSQKAKQIPKVSPSIVKLVGQMKKTLLSAKDPQGVGLAAPQIDKSLQIFIAKQTSKSSIQVFINPKIIQNTKINHLTIDSGRTLSGDTKLEGCLSLPNIWGEVKREPAITISYLDEKGNPRTKTFNNFMATIIRHEMDHLQGILFPKRVLEQKGKLCKSHKNEKGEDIFEEIEL